MEVPGPTVRLVNCLLHEVEAALPNHQLLQVYEPVAIASARSCPDFCAHLLRGNRSAKSESPKATSLHKKLESQRNPWVSLELSGHPLGV